MTSRLLVALLIALVAYVAIYRPAQLRSGASDQEVARAMPGDDIMPQPMFNATRAVTVNASPEQIWPWLLQIGYKRAGWYGYDALDNAGIPSANRIIPELQHMNVGDRVPVWEGVYLEVAAVEPNRYLIWESDLDHSSFVLALYPIDASHTRFVWRIHNAPYQWTTHWIGPQLVTDLADFVAVRQNMLGISARAAGVPPATQAALNAEVAFWSATFLGFLIAASGLILRHDWLRPLVATTATILIIVGLVLLKPPVWLDGLVMLGVFVGLWWLYRPAASPARRQSVAPLAPTIHSLGPPPSPTRVRSIGPVR